MAGFIAKPLSFGFLGSLVEEGHHIYSSDPVQRHSTRHHTSAVYGRLAVESAEAINELVDADTELAEYGTQRPAVQFAVQWNSGGRGRLLLNHHVASTLTGDHIAEAPSECLDQGPR